MSANLSVNSSARWPLALCMVALSAVAAWSVQRASGLGSFGPAAMGGSDALALLALQALLPLLALALCAWRWWQAPGSSPLEADAAEAGASTTVRLRSAGALLVFSLLSVSLIPGGLAQSLGLAWLLALMLLSVGLWVAPRTQPLALRPLPIASALLLPQGLTALALVLLILNKETRSWFGGFWVFWTPLVSALVSTALLTHWAHKERAPQGRRWAMAATAFVLTAGALVSSWWLMAQAAGNQLLPLRETLRALSSLVSWAMRGSPFEVWGSILMVLLAPALVVFWRTKPEKPASVPSHWSWGLTALLVCVMAVGSYGAQASRGASAWTARMGLVNPFASPGYGGGWAGAARSREGSCPANVLSTPLAKRMQAGTLLLVQPEAPRDKGVAHSLVNAMQSSSGIRVNLASEPGVSLPNGWLVRPPQDTRAWTLVVGQVPTDKKEEPVINAFPTVRAALFDEAGQEVGRWQAKGALNTLVGGPYGGCPADKLKKAPTLREYLQLPGVDASVLASTLWAPVVKAEVSLTPIATKTSAPEQEPSALATHACQVQAVAPATTSAEPGRTEVKLTGPAGQLVTLLSPSSRSGYGLRNSPSLLHCTAEGVWVVRRDAASFVRWDSEPGAQARYTTAGVGESGGATAIRVSEDGAYIFAAQDAQVGVAVKFGPVPPRADPKKATAASALQSALLRGDIKRLSREEVADIQAEFVSSHSWSERMSDWFRERDNQKIRTDVPHAGESYLVLKPMAQLPTGGTESYSRPVFYIAKGVPAPTQLNVSARVMDMNTWKCIADSFWCPWPKGATAR